MSAHAHDKRRFQRIEFDAPCELHWQDNFWRTEVLDISMKGVLVRRPDGWSAPLRQPCEVVIHLDDHSTAIVMAVELKHVDEARLGFSCQYIDLESATHLKRLVELNLGDPALLQREFARLVDR